MSSPDWNQLCPVSTMRTLLNRAPATLLLTSMKLVLHVFSAHSMWCTRHACLLQASGAGELRPLSDRQPGPLCFTSHEMHAHVAHPRTQPQTSVLSMPQPPPARPHPLVFSQPSTSQAVSRTDSLGSVASSASLGPRTPFSRQNASTPFSQGRPVLHYQPHLQPSQVQVVSQTAEGRGRGITPGTNGAELALPSMWREHVVQPAPGFAGAHVKALVGEVVRVDSSTGDDTHKVFSKICHRNGWRLYVDVRGE